MCVANPRRQVEDVVTFTPTQKTIEQFSGKANFASSNSRTFHRPEHTEPILMGHNVFNANWPIPKLSFCAAEQLLTTLPPLLPCRWKRWNFFPWTKLSRFYFSYSCQTIIFQPQLTFGWSGFVSNFCVLHRMSTTPQVLSCTISGNPDFCRAGSGGGGKKSKLIFCVANAAPPPWNKLPQFGGCSLFMFCLTLIWMVLDLKLGQSLKIITIFYNETCNPPKLIFSLYKQITNRF